MNLVQVGSSPSGQPNLRVRGVRGSMSGFQPGGAGSNPAGRTNRSVWRIRMARDRSAKPVHEGSIPSRHSATAWPRRPSGWAPVFQAGSCRFESCRGRPTRVAQRKGARLRTGRMGVRVSPWVPSLVLDARWKSTGLRSRLDEGSSPSEDATFPPTDGRSRLSYGRDGGSTPPGGTSLGRSYKKGGAPCERSYWIRVISRTVS